MAALQHHNLIQVAQLIDMPDDGPKVTEEKDPKNPNTSDFRFEKEDHTLANLLRMKLHENPMVRFAAYRVPHPARHVVTMKIQTAPDRSQRKLPTPAEALDKAIEECLADLDCFGRLFEEAERS